MTQIYIDLAARYRFNEKTAQFATTEFSDEDWSRLPSESGGNSAHWILGHLSASRRYLLRKLGAALPMADWEEAFGAGVDPVVLDGHPSPAEFAVDLEACGARLEETLGALTQEAADAEWGGSGFPDGSTTIGGGAHFLHFHESYHVGQLGLIRRICGRPGFV